MDWQTILLLAIAIPALVMAAYLQSLQQATFNAQELQAKNDGRTQTLTPQGLKTDGGPEGSVSRRIAQIIAPRELSLETSVVVGKMTIPAGTFKRAGDLVHYTSVFNRQAAAYWNVDFVVSDGTNSVTLTSTGVTTATGPVRLSHYYADLTLMPDGTLNVATYNADLGSSQVATVTLDTSKAWTLTPTVAKSATAAGHRYWMSSSLELTPAAP